MYVSRTHRTIHRLKGRGHAVCETLNTNTTSKLRIEFLQACHLADCSWWAGSKVPSGSGERLPSPEGWIVFQEQVSEPAIALVASKLLGAAMCVGES